MWCKDCYHETQNEKCELCGSITDDEIPVEIYWCNECLIPVVKLANSVDKEVCPLCNEKTVYLSTDLRPVFPEERLLFEILQGTPLAHKNKSVWASKNRYYINGSVISVSTKDFREFSAEKMSRLLNKYQKMNDYDFFNRNINKFINANRNRVHLLINEAHDFIQRTAKPYPRENVVVSFSGGKDSAVTADLTVRALSDPSLVHIFGNTTLEFPHTLEYVKRFRDQNPKAIFKTAINKDQNFFDVCDDIGPPARMLRWCCSMFKTGPITRVINSMYRDEEILSFYGIRKCESVSRSHYNRVEDSAESIKIQKQKVASPIFYWRDIDIWLYILSEKIDFNKAYRLGYDRVGCWCCPNNSDRAQFLSKVYMSEQYEKWHAFLVQFASKIGKPDAENYIDSGGWKARQGGNGLVAAADIKIKFTNCTAEENAKIYQLNKEVYDSFYMLFIPFGRLAPELGKKIINETIVVDLKSQIPIISIQPLTQNETEITVKIKTMNVANHDELQRKISYQIRKYNACRQCLKCESLCKYGAISIVAGEYRIDDKKCKRCKMCVTAKYLDGGCLMDKYLKTKI